MRLIFTLWAGVFLSLGGCSSQSEAPQDSGLPKGAVRLGSAALKFSDGTYGVTFLGDGKQFAMLNHNRIRIFETATAKEVRGWKAVPDRIVVAHFPKLTLYEFCLEKAPFPEFLKVFEELARTEF